MLETDRLGVMYGAAEALSDVSLRVEPGTITAIVGPNGAGKSTCLKAISGLVEAGKGAITLDGRPIEHLRPEQRLTLGIAHVLEGRRLFADQTVEDNLVLGAYCGHRRPGWKAGTRDRCDEMYGRFPILGQRRRQLSLTLSGGEQMMLAIAVALMARPRLLLLDEPSLGLAPKMVDAIGSFILELRNEGVTIVLVEQMASLALRLADFVYAFQHGRVVSSGPKSQFTQDGALRAAYFGAA